MDITEKEMIEDYLSLAKEHKECAEMAIEIVHEGLSQYCSGNEKASSLVKEIRTMMKTKSDFNVFWRDRVILLERNRCRDRLFEYIKLDDKCT